MPDLGLIHITAGGGTEYDNNGWYYADIKVQADGTGGDENHDTRPSLATLIQDDPDGFAQALVDWIKTKITMANHTFDVQAVTVVAENTLYP